VDSAGNVLVTGDTNSSGWVSGGFDTTYGTGSDAFAAKLSPSGGHLWSTYLGDSSGDYGHGIAVDAAGNALVTGRTYSPGWVSGGFDTTYDGFLDAFVAKLSPSGGHVWSTYLGGSNDDFGNGIGVDSAGNVLVTGGTSSSGWVSGAFDTTLDGGEDAFVANIGSMPLAVDDIGIPQIATAKGRWLFVNAQSGPTGPLGVGVLANDVGDAGGQLVLTVTDTSNLHGLLQLENDGSFFYAPLPSFVGVASFQYRVDNAFGSSNWATAQIVVTSHAEIEVLGNGLSIANGDATPSASDATDFGVLLASGTALTKTFVVQNLGTTALSLTGSPVVGIVGSGFTVSRNPAATIPAGGMTSLDIRFTPTTNGTYSATVRIDNDDVDENPFQ
jgi:hypothetical protein